MIDISNAIWLGLVVGAVVWAYTNWGSIAEMWEYGHQPVEIKDDDEDLFI